LEVRLSFKIKGRLDHKCWLIGPKWILAFHALRYRRLYNIGSPQVWQFHLPKLSIRGIIGILRIIVAEIIVAENKLGGRGREGKGI
jgi:hypothetical protein